MTEAHTDVWREADVAGEDRHHLAVADEGLLDSSLRRAARLGCEAGEGWRVRSGASGEVAELREVGRAHVVDPRAECDVVAEQLAQLVGVGDATDHAEQADPAGLGQASKVT